MNQGQIIVILLSAIMGVWFFLGSIYNRRRGMAIYNWLRSGIEQFGKLSEARWIGSSGSGARLVISQAKSPFQRIEIVFLLESREILPLWIFNHLRGKRDEMIMKANLRSVPGQEIEIAREGNREMEKILSSSESKPYERFPVNFSHEAPGYIIAIHGIKDEQNLEYLEGVLQAYSNSLWRVSLQRKAPHLVLRANLPDFQNTSPEEYFSGLSKLVR